MSPPLPEKGSPVSTEEQTADWYARYYAHRGGDRNDLLRNSEVLFQTLAVDAAVVRGLRSTGLDPTCARVLDVGCGGGGSLIHFLRAGFDPDLLYGVDIQPDRIRKAEARFPNAHFSCGDARNIAHADGFFDLVFESTMFVQILDDSLAAGISREMLRVTRPGGYLMIVDWRYDKPWDRSYRAVSSSRIRRLFAVGSTTVVHGVYRGALLPPLGRLLSRFLPGLYFLVQATLPFLVGQVATVLQRTPRDLS